MLDLAHINKTSREGYPYQPTPTAPQRPPSIGGPVCSAPHRHISY